MTIHDGREKGSSFRVVTRQLFSTSGFTTPLFPAIMSKPHCVACGWARTPAKMLEVHKEILSFSDFV